MKQHTELFLTPVGRMVMGSLYNPQTKSMDGKPLTFSSGKNEGKPRVNYFCALAIKKNGETHWNQTEWGAKIYSAAVALHPNEINLPTFSWKIVNGDDPKFKERIGYPGHWVLTFGGAFAPAIIDRNREYLTKENAVNCGDYVQMNMSVNSNKSKVTKNAGLALNYTHVALIGYGEPIEFKKQIDPKTLNISSQLPPGASETPVTHYSSEQGNYVSTQPPVAVPPPPYPQILNGSKKMTPQAPGTYEQMVSWGWTDALLIERGMMVP